MIGDAVGAAEGGEGVVAAGTSARAQGLHVVEGATGTAAGDGLVCAEEIAVVHEGNGGSRADRVEDRLARARAVGGLRVQDG